MKTKIILGSIILTFALANVSQAALVNCGQNVNGKQTTGTNTNTAGEKNQSNDCTLSDLVNQIFRIVNFLIGSATVLAIGYVLYGGLRMIIARGDPKAYATAKSTMTFAVEGLIIVLLAYVIVDYAIVFISGGKLDFKTLYQAFPIK
jgi:hypothetical protein